MKTVTLTEICSAMTELRRAIPFKRNGTLGADVGFFDEMWKHARDDFERHRFRYLTEVLRNEDVSPSQ